MQHSFLHVKVDGILGILGNDADSISTRELGEELHIEEKRLRRFVKTNGFERLSIIKPPLTMGDLCVKGAKEIFNKLQITADSIDALLFATQSPDYMIPPTTFTIQQKIGLKHDALLLDITKGCPGYISSLAYAASLIESKVCKRVMVCVGDLSNHNVGPNVTQPEAYLETGDACSITILSYTETPSLLDFSIKNYGEFYQTVIDTSYGTKALRDPASNDKGFFIDGPSMNIFVLDTVTKNIQSFLKDKNMNFDSFECCIAQQTAKTLLQAISLQLGAPDNFIPFFAEQTGNLSIASVPLSICAKAQMDNKFTKPLLLVSFGVGLSCSICALDLSTIRHISHITI